MWAVIKRCLKLVSLNYNVRVEAIVVEGKKK